MDFTLLLIKPNDHIGVLINRFEQKGYKLLGLKLMQVSPQLLQKYDRNFEVERKHFHQQLPILVMVWTGLNVINFAVELFNLNRKREIIYTTDNQQAAEQEMKFWFAQ